MPGPEAPDGEARLRLLARLAGIEIAPGYVPGVIRNLEILLGQAAVLGSTAIDPWVEPAAVYRP